MPQVVEDTANTRLVHYNRNGREVPLSNATRRHTRKRSSAPRSPTVSRIADAPPFDIRQLISVVESATDKDAYELFTILMAKHKKYNTDVVLPAETTAAKERGKKSIRRFLSEFSIDDFIKENVLSKMVKTITGRQLAAVWNYAGIEPYAHGRDSIPIPEKNIHREICPTYCPPKSEEIFREYDSARTDLYRKFFLKVRELSNRYLPVLKFGASYDNFDSKGDATTVRMLKEEVLKLLEQRLLMDAEIIRECYSKQKEIMEEFIDS